MLRVTSSKSDDTAGKIKLEHHILFGNGHIKVGSIFALNPKMASKQRSSQKVVIFQILLRGRFLFEKKTF